MPLFTGISERLARATRRFTREEYHLMAKAGILAPTDRTELLDGEISLMSPIGSGHQGMLNTLNTFFMTRLAAVTIVSLRGPLAAADDSEPQPDLMLLRPRADFYRAGHPTPRDVLLLIEVADTSVALDRGAKLALYARAGVAEYWVIDLPRATLIVHKRPTGEEYADVKQLDRNATIAPDAFPDCRITLADLFA